MTIALRVNGASMPTSAHRIQNQLFRSLRYFSVFFSAPGSLAPVLRPRNFGHSDDEPAREQRNQPQHHANSMYLVPGGTFYPSMYELAIKPHLPSRYQVYDTRSHLRLFICLSKSHSTSNTITVLVCSHSRLLILWSPPLNYLMLFSPDR